MTKAEWRYDDGCCFQVRGLTRIYQVGKSTLLNILGGLDQPTSGRVIYGGRHDLVNATERELTEYRCYHIGFVFQFYNLIPSLTARENVAVVTEIARNPIAPKEALELVHLADHMDHFPAQLSGG